MRIVALLASAAMFCMMGQARAAEPVPSTQPGRRLNVLLITADDMAYDSLGATGCKIPGITPNLDKLAAEGMRFTRAHVTISVCQPSRSVLMTGRYPVRNGALGFEPIRPDVPTLGESLQAAGYFKGIFAKVPHLAPLEKFHWDMIVKAEQLSDGRNPALYYEQMKVFLDRARSEGKPFFLMANSQDPHRPFAGVEPPPRQAARPRRQARESGPASAVPYKTYRPEDVEVPGFLPNLPEIRQELAQYYSSVNRCDQIVGQLLRALDEAGQRDNTVVMFLSDNGISMPFAKTNCYPFSTRTPWIVRWPGKVRAGAVEEKHFISGIDFLPTVLEALQLPPITGVDGRSFLPLLTGGEQPGRDRVFTTFHQTSARKDFPMRAIHTARFSYIYNAWSDGKLVFQNEARGSRSFKAMEKAAATDPAVAARVQFFSLRAAEELYDLEKDPCCLHNLVADPAYRQELDRMRQETGDTLDRLGDPLAAGYKHRPPLNKLDEAERAMGFVPLFNGMDLAGWVHKGKSGSFVVRDGVIVGDRSGNNELAYWLSTEREYADFELRLQYKISPGGNSGIFIRVPQEGWPSEAGMEVQILDDEGKSGKPTARDTGSIYRIVAPTAFAQQPAGQWNDLWIACDGDRVRLTMNGRVILDASMNDYEKLKDHPRKGFIGLSAHTLPVQFRNIRLRALGRAS